MEPASPGPKAVLIAGVVGAVFLPGIVAAQGLKEVVVTAERREGNLQEVPVAVTALSGERLACQGIGVTQDVAKTVPNRQLLPLTANPSTFQIGLEVERS